MAFGKGHHLSLIDGSAFVFRAFHALPPLTRRSDGLPVGAVSGFVNMLWKMMEDNKGPDAPTHMAVVFDKGSHTFRNDLYKLYKANREEMPEDLRPQIPLTRDATRAFNIACLEEEGYEADDIIATLARTAREAGGRVTIVSSDKDLMQLVGEGVEMHDAMKNVRIDAEGVEERFGVRPDKVIDVQSLAGDSVDNIPGAPGIGVKTAALLISEFGDLDTLLSRADEIKQEKRRQTLIDHKDQILLSRKLVTLVQDMDLPYSLDSLEVKEPSAEDLLAFLTSMEFRTITGRVAKALGREVPAARETAAPQQEGKTPETPPIDHGSYVRIGDAATLDAWGADARAMGRIAIDTETTGLDEMRAELVGISLAVWPGKACYVPLIHKASAGENLFESGEIAEGQMKAEDALAILKPILEDPAILKIGQNLKYDAKILARHGVRIAPFDDTLLMSYAMNAGLHSHGMDTLSERYLSHRPIEIKSLLGTGKSQITFDKVPIEEAVKYASEDADITLRLWQLFKPELHRKKVTTVYETLERPLVPVLAQMEMHGIKVDAGTLARMSNSFAQKMAELEDAIHALAGTKFNVGSPSQVGDILFDRMGIAGGKKGKT
ncbi:MAG: DNA polymerase I, partial [Boseongicola sp.]|nr:DNA polymerase I [Boseongicola sp.]